MLILYYYYIKLYYITNCYILTKAPLLRLPILMELGGSLSSDTLTTSVSWIACVTDQLHLEVGASVGVPL